MSARDKEITRDTVKELVGLKKVLIGASLVSVFFEECGSNKLAST